MKNDWRDIEGFEGLYQINSESIVRSVDRYVTQLSNNGNVYRRICKGRIIKAFENKSGYLSVGLTKEGKTIKRSVHRLLYLSFNNIKNKEAEGLDINHIDHNKLNNNLDNLELVTRSENIKKHDYLLWKGDKRKLL